MAEGVSGVVGEMAATMACAACPCRARDVDGGTESGMGMAFDGSEDGYEFLFEWLEVGWKLEGNREFVIELWGCGGEGGADGLAEGADGCSKEARPVL